MTKFYSIKALLFIASVAILSSCSNKQYNVSLIEKHPVLPEYAQHKSEAKQEATAENTASTTAPQQTKTETTANASKPATSNEFARKKSAKRIGLFNPVNNFLAAKSISKQVKALQVHKGTAAVKSGGLSAKMKQGIMLILVGILIWIIAAVLAMAIGGWGLAWLIYLIGSIVFIVGCVIIILELLDM